MGTSKNDFFAQTIWCKHYIFRGLAGETPALPGFLEVPLCLFGPTRVLVALKYFFSEKIPLNFNEKREIWKFFSLFFEQQVFSFVLNFQNARLVCSRYFTNG